MSRSRAIVVVGSMVLACTASAYAQVGYLWTYEELLAKADLVVIAQCSGSVDIGRARHPELSPAFPVIEMQTAFVVKAILKNAGPAVVGPDQVVRLQHFRRDEERWRQESQIPAGAPFGIINAGNEVLPDVRHSYLLFLTAMSDGTYAPLSGHDGSTRGNKGVRKDVNVTFPS